MTAHPLEDQVALVTGASRGIGRGIAKRLAAAGASVIVNYHRNEEAALEVVASIVEAGGKARAVQADAGDAKAVDAMFREVQSTEGRLDVLVNNAGLLKDGPLAGLREADWQRVLDVNLGGPFLCTRRALRAMLPQRSGRIVNLASIQAVRGGRGQSNYAAAKAGVLALTRAVALEVAEYGIRVNAVLPGFIDTDMTKVVKRRAGDEVLGRIPVGRFGTPDDVAGLVLFLCTRDADYITGQALVVDGGLSIA